MNQWSAMGHPGPRRAIPGRLGLATVLCLLILLLGGSADASGSGPWTPAVPVQAPRQWAGEAADEQTPNGVQQPLALPPLKAVLIVGPIDGDYGSWTTAEKTNMDLAAAELAAHGVTVHKFYTPNNDWNQIKAAAQGAHFLFYRGHGIYWSPMPTPIVGGFALKDKFVSSDDIRADLHLARNSIVMLYACFSAGTAGNDTGSITSQEAQRRVAMYSDPFLDVGTAGYYADWFGDAFEKFVRYLFEGQTLGQAYESFYDFRASSVERYVHPDHAEAVMWLDKDFWNGQTQYNDAFVGRPGLRLTDLFGLLSMQVTPSSTSYLATPVSPARTLPITVSSPEGALLNWTASLAPADLSWLSLHATSGDSSQPIEVTVSPGGRPEGTYTAELRINSDTPALQSSSFKVPITMRLVSKVNALRLPVIRR